MDFPCARDNYSEKMGKNSTDSGGGGIRAEAGGSIRSRVGEFLKTLSVVREHMRGARAFFLSTLKRPRKRWMSRQQGMKR